MDADPRLTDSSLAAFSPTVFVLTADRFLATRCI
jgi:hypothetical protein